MPKTDLHRIPQLDEERLLYGILPLPWMLILLTGFTIYVFVIGFPSDLGRLFFTVLYMSSITGFLVAVHRVHRAKLIKHFVKWHDAGLGGVAGRDLLPIPHRYQELSEAEEQSLRRWRQLDRERGRQTARQWGAARVEGRRQEAQARQRQAQARRRAG